MQLQRPLAVVAPTLDVDVLAVLARADAAFTPGQTARLLAGPSVEGVRRVLRRLTDQGIVHAEEIGSAVRYRLNRDHLAAPSIIALATQRSALLARLGQAIDGWGVPALYAALFGSAARGEMRPDSDLDLFVVQPSDATLGDQLMLAEVFRETRDADWERQLDALASDATLWTGNDTRILAMTEDEVVTGVGARAPILRSIIEEGLTVAGDPRWLRRLQGQAAAAR